MRRSLKSSVCAAALTAALALGAAAALPSVSISAPVPYVNSPMDTPQGLVNQAIVNLNAQVPALQNDVTCSGNTTMTCNGTRIVASVTNLTTAAVGVVSALVTVTDGSVTGASDAFCQVNDYAGTGQPLVANLTTNAGNLTFAIQNNAPSGGGSLSATVPVACQIFN